MTGLTIAMPKFRMPADAGEWFKFPPEFENMEGHTGPWMGLTVRRDKTDIKYRGEPELAWHVKFSRAGCETTMTTRQIEQYKCPEVIELDELDPMEVEFMRNMGVKDLPEFGRAKRHAAKKSALPEPPEP